jgi:hypothetical protein
MRRKSVSVPLDPSSVLTHAELARHLKCSERALERWDPPSVRLGEGRSARRYLWADIVTWLHRENGGRAA